MSRWRAIVGATLPEENLAEIRVGRFGPDEPIVSGKIGFWLPSGYARPLVFSLALHLIFSLSTIPVGPRHRAEPPRPARFNQPRIVMISPPAPAAAARLRPASQQVRPPEPPPDMKNAHVVPRKIPPATVTPRTNAKPREATPPRAGARRPDAPKEGPVTGRLDSGGVVRSELPQVGDHGGALEIRAEGEDLGYNYYFAMLLRKIGEQWEPPPGIRGDEVAAVVNFTVLRDGSVPPVSVEEPSGVDAFDSSAMRAVTRAAPLPPLPQEYAGDQIVFHLRFVYSREAGSSGRNP